MITLRMSMKKSKPQCTYFRVLLLLCFIMIGNGQLFAKLIEPESLLLQIVEKYKKVNYLSMYLEVEVKVFDPEAFFPLEEKYEQGTLSYELIEKSYLQKMMWVRDENLLIETLDLEFNPLHVFIYETESSQFSKNLQTDRLFTINDATFPHFLFYTKHISVLKEELFSLGVSTSYVKIKQKNFQNVYQLGTETENILVDSNNFKVLEINRQIQISGRYYPSKIVFSQWHKKKNRIPGLTQFYIDSRLFKEIRIIKYQGRGVSIKRRKFLKQYRKLIPDSQQYSVGIVYSQ